MSNDEIMQRVEEDDRWDSGALGRCSDHAQRANLSDAEIESINEAAGLQMISIRLPKALIDDFRFLADHHGLRYQTLMRQTLVRFAEGEMKNLAREAAAAQIAQRRAEQFCQATRTA